MDSSSGAETNENLKMILFLRALVQEKSSQGVIRRAVMGLKQIFELPRASLVISRPDDVKAHVVADVDGDIQHYEISAEDYPELRELHETREPVFIRDVFSDPRLARVLDKLRTASSPGKSVLLLPLRFDDSLFGALVLRSDDHSLDDSHEAINFGRLLATCIATAISHTLEKDLLLEEANFLRAQHQKDLVEIETLKQFAEFFDLARDGFVVTDSSGWIRYANSSAEGMLSLEKEDSESIKMMALLESGSRDFLFQLLSGKIEASSAEYFDLHVQANQRILSATARVFDPQGVWMIGFRDVTHVRLMDEDFRKTKDFLENVIENSVDAIVASDTKGRIILFNRAAETILEYSASEVIAELTSVQLYEPGVAYRIMNQLRSFQFGGKGRLETTRQRILSKSGESIPVNLSAAILYDDGIEIGTVGIFTDLRERLKVAEKLRAAEEELRERERHKLTIELAGAAAHELNQPLTSIVGYSDILSRRLPEDERLHRAVNIIVQESTRMAEIVKRLGKLTTRKTKEYIGETSILHLNRGLPLETGLDRGEEEPYE